MLDLSGNDNDGTIHGCTDTEGIHGRAKYFDGSNDWIDVLHDLGNPSEMTISLWIYIEPGDQTRMQYLADARNGGNWWFLQSYNPTGSGNINYNNQTTVDPSDWSDGEWTHVCLTATGSATHIYINGVERSSPDTGFNPDIGYDLHFGTRYTNSSYFRGKMDEIAVFNRAISASEALRLYQKNNLYEIDLEP